MVAIRFDGAGTYSPHEGKGSDLLQFQGKTFGVIKSVKLGKANDSGNTTLDFEIFVEEEEAKGKKITKSQPVTGTRKDGKPNYVGLFDIMVSAYTGTEPNEESAVAKVRALDGQELDTDAIIQELTGCTVWVEVQARKFARKDGSTAWSSSIKNFIAKSRYEEAASLNVHHTANPPEVAGSSNGVSTGTTTVSSTSATKAAQAVL